MTPEEIAGDEAFDKQPGDCDIPLKGVPDHAFAFSRRWFFKRNLCTYSTHLASRYDGTHPVQMLQLGIWEGADLIWQMQNTLKHPRSVAIAIDPWSPTDRYPAPDIAKVRQRFYRNIEPYQHKVHILETTSQEAFAKGHVSGPFDYAIIDGDHDATSVYADAVNCLGVVRHGGWMVFDDVRAGRGRRSYRHHVRAGLERFLREYGHRVDHAWSHRYCECLEVRG